MEYMHLYITVLFIATLITDVASRPPNIIVILADDLGWADVSFHGSDQIPTPNLDALAYDGVMLTQYYVEQICTPSRAALLTGRHPIHLGLQHSVIFGSMAYGLGLNETLMPQYLKQLGYSTHMIGKWHLGFLAREYTPPYRGFDSFYGFLGGMEDYWDHTRREGPGGDKDWGFDFYEDESVRRDVFGQYSTQLYTERAAKLIQDHDVDKPFFLYFAHQAPHNANSYRPLEAPDEYMQRFQHIQHEGRRTYAAMLSAVDDSVGNLTDQLRQRGMLNNTIIVFSTDNGGPAHGFSHNHASNFPLRGMKYTQWEGGVRGTGFVWSPLLTSSPRVSQQLMHIVDILPTVLHAAGYDMSKLPAHKVDGVDMWDALCNDTPSPRTEVILGIDPLDEAPGSYALRMGDYKLISCNADRDGWYEPEGAELNSTGCKSSETWAHRHSLAGQALASIGRKPVPSKPFLVDCGPKPANASKNCQPNITACLFDVISDPCEYNNLAGQLPDVHHKLEARLKQYEAGAVKMRNKAFDPAGSPSRHGGVWQPWTVIGDGTNGSRGLLSRRDGIDMSMEIIL